MSGVPPPCTILTNTIFTALAPNPTNPPYSYAGLCTAIDTWNTANPTNQIFLGPSELDRKNELAAFLGHTLHESGNFVFPRELSQCPVIANSDGSIPWTSGVVYCQPPGYSSTDGPYTDPYCSLAHTTTTNPDGCNCGPSVPNTAGAGYDASKLFFGRGPLQLSWNFNYIDAGAALNVDLCANPDLVASDEVVSWGTAIHFWMENTGSAGTTSHDGVTVDLDFGESLNTINGGLECNAGNIFNRDSTTTRLDKYCKSIVELGANLLSFDGCPGLQAVHDSCISGGAGTWGECTSCDAITSITQQPTTQPTTSPTSQPTTAPTSAPTPASGAPSNTPTMAPTSAPTPALGAPTNTPTTAPTSAPTPALGPPTNTPTTAPTTAPTPTLGPPTNTPTTAPTSAPTPALGSPTKTPTTAPTSDPSAQPTSIPTPTITPKPTPNPVPTPGGSGSGDWYVGSDSQTCVQDCAPTATAGSCGGLAQPWDFLFQTVTQCCQIRLPYKNLRWCEENSRANLYPGSGEWYIDYTGSKCVRDCAPGGALDTNNECAGIVEDALVPLFPTSSACCTTTIPWVDLRLCESNSDPSSTGTQKYYAANPGGKCMKDCDPGSSSGPAECGRVTDLSKVLFNTISECCTLGQSWVDERFCASRSVGTYSGAWFVDSGTNSKCVKDCASGAGPLCADVDSPSTPIYETAEECCREKLSWVDLNRCVDASEGTTPPSNGEWYVDFSILGCVEDCVGPPPCGGLRENWEFPYPDKASCCATVPWYTSC